MRVKINSMKHKKTTQDNSHSVTIAVALHQARLGVDLPFEVDKDKAKQIKKGRESVSRLA